MCECADPMCTQRIAASLAEYEEVRAEGDTFLVVDGHVERADLERVVARQDGFKVVRKLRELGALVRRLEPARRTGSVDARDEATARASA